ncbi:MAG: acetyl/propionyl/methylcrotonyl-CoA carboxylase subunit alpha, partial [Nocardioidaceae bacterium]
GEIALRVIRTVAEAGLHSVAVYSDADRAAPHVRQADRAVRIGPATAAESYLSIPALLDAAARTGADAIHPGYGFLSERADFARAVTGAGLVFIGPPADVIEAMGRKDRARAIAQGAGVPVIPAADLRSLRASGADPSGSVLVDAVADQIGFPLLVKAVAGGGGKGMRIVRSAADLPGALAAAQREAGAAFGDDTMLFERYVEHGRHIEVQILADQHGKVVHLFERDCSVQRRHQKVVEEAPASTLRDDLRGMVLTAAVDLAREVGYVNAGTVEFLVAGDEVYFLEMNTRLQVEHPVTEAVTGRDLVALQLCVARGEALPFEQHDIQVRGHAIEARVYAEDPAYGFLPQAGLARLVHWPQQARVDAALESGQQVSTYYDPLLGKITASGATREAARLALVDALDTTAIVGLTTNVGFLRDLVASSAFSDLEIDTAWLDQHPQSGTPEAAPDVFWWLAAWAATVTAATGVPEHPFHTSDGWRLAGPPAWTPVQLTRTDAAGVGTESGDMESRALLVHPIHGTVMEAEREVRLAPRLGRDGWVHFELDGVSSQATVICSRGEVVVVHRGGTASFQRPDAFGRGHAAVVGGGSVAAPMPGTVLLVHVESGDEVAAGDTLGILEAMKMELALTAPFAGVVVDVHAVEGGQVDRGEPLFVVEPVEPDQGAP